VQYQRKLFLPFIDPFLHGQVKVGQFVFDAGLIEKVLIGV
jgi:hypothetical protein